MSRRVVQYQDVAKVGLMGAIKAGDFLGEGSDDSNWTPDVYVRQELALAMMERDGGYGMCFDYQTGLPEAITPNFTTAEFKCNYKLPLVAEGVEVVIKFAAPEYMEGQGVSGAFVIGCNYETAVNSPVTGGTAIYIDEACTTPPDWLVHPRFGHYFVCPKHLYFKMKAGEGGSTALYPSEKYSTVYFSLTYAAKDTLYIYQ